MGKHGEELVLGAIRLLRVLLRFFEGVFRVFAFCDFENGAEESRRPAGIVEEDASFFLEPAFSRISGVEGPILDFVMAAAAGAQNLARRLVNDMPVIRMNAVEVGNVIWLGPARQAK